MSVYVNTGTNYATDGSDVPTKKALKEALAASPASVVFYETSAVPMPILINGSELVEGVKYSVTGPNPYKNRKWYATVELTGGKIKVS